MADENFFNISPLKSNITQQRLPCQSTSSMDNVHSNIHDLTRKDTTGLNSPTASFLQNSSDIHTRVTSENHDGTHTSLESWDPMGADYSCPTFNSYTKFDVLASEPPKQRSPEKCIQSPPQKNKPEDISLYVANIPIQMTQEGLRNLFQGAGKVHSCCVLPPNDPTFETKIGFVTFHSWKEASRAIECYDGFGLGGNVKLRVKVANKKGSRGGNLIRNDNDYSFSEEDNFDGPDSFEKPIMNGLNQRDDSVETESKVTGMVKNTVEEQRSIVKKETVPKNLPLSGTPKEMQPCTRCQKPCTQRCSACKAPYCSRECQKVDRVDHKKICSFGMGKQTTPPKPVVEHSVDPLNDIDFDCIDISTDVNKNITKNIEKDSMAMKVLLLEQSQVKEIETNGIQNDVNPAMHTKPVNTQPGQLPLLHSVTQGPVNILVTSIVSSICFWGQIVDSHFFSRLLQITEEFTTITEKCLQKVVQPIPGMHCLTRFTQDNGWYRSRVVEVNNKQVKVIFVDYGNVEWKNGDELYILPEQFFDLPGQARLFTLSSVAGSKNKDIEQAVVSFVDGLLSGSVFEATVVCTEPGCYPEVVLKHTTSEQTINEIVLEKQKSLDGNLMTQPDLPQYIPKSSISPLSIPQPSVLSLPILPPVNTTQPACRSLSSSSRPSTPSTPSCDDGFKIYMASDLASDVFSSKKDLDIFVSEVISPTVFWIQFPATAINHLDQLDATLAATYNQSQYSEYVPSIGEVVVAKFTDGLWYRAKVEFIYNDGSLRVLFLDHGNTDDVRLIDIRRITPELVTTPKLAIRCSLASILSPTETGHWSSECIDFCKTLMLNKRCTASIEGHDDNTIMLCVKVNDSSCTVNEELVMAGHAIYKSQMPEHQLHQNTLPNVAQSTTTIPSPNTSTSQFETNPSLSGQRYGQQSPVLVPDILNQQPQFSSPQDGTPLTFSETTPDAATPQFASNAEDPRYKVPGIPQSNLPSHCDSHSAIPRHETSTNFSPSLPISNTKSLPYQNEITSNSLQPTSTNNQVGYINSPTFQFEAESSQHIVRTSLPDSQSSQPKRHEPKSEHSPLFGSQDSHRLPQQNIPPSSFDVVVNDVVSGNEFYAQMIESNVIHQLHKCVRELNEYCNNSKQSLDRNAQVGSLGCARFSLDNIWYRAEVLNLEKNGYKVRFIDFGNTEVVSQDAFLHPPDIFYQLAPLALCCRLVTGPVNVGTRQNRDMLEKLTRNRRMICTALSTASRPYLVKLEYLCQDKMVDIAEELQKGLPSCATSECPPTSQRSTPTSQTAFGNYVPRHNTTTTSPRRGSASSETSSRSSSLSLTNTRTRSIFGEAVLVPAIKSSGIGCLGESCDLLTTDVKHPTYFWVQRGVRSDIEQLNNLTIELNQHYNGISYPPFEPELNAFCACKYSADKTWYRGFLKCDSQKRWVVHFVDFGNSEVTTPDMLRPLDDKFLVQPFRAMLCSLACVEPVDGKFWSKEAIEYFQNKVAGKLLKCTIVFNSMSRLFIHIQDPDLEEESLRAGLIAKGMAKESGSYTVSSQDVIPGKVIDDDDDDEADKSSSLESTRNMIGNLSLHDVASSQNENQTAQQATTSLQNERQFSYPGQSISNNPTTSLGIPNPTNPAIPVQIQHQPPPVASEPKTSVSNPYLPSDPVTPLQKPMAVMFPSVVVDYQNHFKVLVSEVTSPNEVYFNVAEPDTVASFSALFQNLNDHFKNTNQTYVPVPGELCCAQFSADLSWYRAVVCTVNTQNATVQFVDYGNTDTVQFSSIRPIPPMFTKLPFFARRACLAGVNSDVAWAEDRLAHLRAMLLTKPLMVRVVRDLEGVLETEFYDTSGDDDIFINALFTEKRNSLTAPEFVTSLQIPELIPTNDELEVVVSEVNGPDCFWIQNVNADVINLFASMTMQMNADCENAHDNLSAVNVGDVCCSKFSLDGQWYRARVEELLGKGQARVFYVDFGNREVVDIAGLKPLNHCYSEVPAQAIKCTLGKIQPAQSTWSPNAVGWLKSRIFGKRLIAKVLERLGSVLKLELIDTSLDDRDIIINAELVQMGEATCV